MQLRSHQVAHICYTLVEKRNAELNADMKKAYASLAHKAPVLILQHGLAHSSGFLLAKGGDEHLALLEDICQAFAQLGERFADKQDFHCQVIQSDLKQTLQLTTQALAITQSIKRYVQGVMRIDPTGNIYGGDKDDDPESSL